MWLLVFVYCSHQHGQCIYYSVPCFVSHLDVPYWLFSSKALCLKAVGIQKQVLAGGLLSCAGEHHIQAQLAVGWVAGGQQVKCVDACRDEPAGAASCPTGAAVMQSS